MNPFLFPKAEQDIKKKPPPEDAPAGVAAIDYASSASSVIDSSTQEPPVKKSHAVEPVEDSKRSGYHQVVDAVDNKQDNTQNPPFKKRQANATSSMAFLEDTTGNASNEGATISIKAIKESSSKIHGMTPKTSQQEANDKRWEKQFHLLCDYQANHGHLRMPSTYQVQGFNLGKWVNDQQRNYRKKKLKPERKHKLDTICFPWKPESLSKSNGNRSVAARGRPCPLRKSGAKAAKSLRSTSRRILVQVPHTVKSMFGKIGFAKFGKSINPICFCSPFDMPRDSQPRKQWFETFDKVIFSSAIVLWLSKAVVILFVLMQKTCFVTGTLQLKRDRRLDDMPHLVYWYGEIPERRYGFVSHASASSYDKADDGQFGAAKKSYVALRKKVTARLALTRIEVKMVPAMEEMFKDLGKEPRELSRFSSSESKSESDSDSESESESESIGNETPDSDDLVDREKQALDALDRANKTNKLASVAKIQAQITKVKAHTDLMNKQAAMLKTEAEEMRLEASNL